MRKVEVAIIGAGTAGLTARREIAKKTDDYVIIDDGPMGTTCARVGCMPSKVLIQAANDFHRRHAHEVQGIVGQLEINPKQTMEHVRSLRDRFVRGVKSSEPQWSDKLIRKRASFIDEHTLDLGDEKIYADKIIIATGSRPIIPRGWSDYQNHFITTDEFFELEELPKKIAVIGLGVIGIEIGQALNRLGVEVLAVGLGKSIAGISDPKLQDYVLEKMSEEMPIYTTGAQLVGVEDNQLQIEVDGKIHLVEKAILAMGRRSNLDRVDIEKISTNPKVSNTTMALIDHEHIFVPGDANGERTILHEAADEGIIAGYNIVNGEQCFKKRPALGITFSDPNIATIGQRFDELENFVVGEVSFEGQGRSIVKLKEKGRLHLYADKNSGQILGAELFAPDGEHLAHLIAWGIALKLTVQEMLTMPFYHPVIEEGLRTALRDARDKLENTSSLEILRCQDTPIR